MQPIRILLIARPGPALEKYRKAVTRPGVVCDTASSFAPLPPHVAGNSYSGVLVDLATKIRAMKRHREFVTTILDQFPMAQLNLDRKTGQVRVHTFGRYGDDRLADFIETRCRPFPPRRFRLHARRPLHLNALVETADGGEPVPSVTINVSEGGCFIFSVAPLPPGTAVRLRFLELSEAGSFEAVVRHQRPWGQARCLPGMGLEFGPLTRGQRERLMAELAGIAPSN